MRFVIVEPPDFGEWHPQKHAATNKEWKTFKGKNHLELMA
jgi:hypothetical protein